MRRFKDFSTMAMIAVCWSMAALTAYWTTDYLRPPIAIVSNTAEFDVVHSRMRLDTKFVWDHRCEGSLRVWIRSNLPEPPPRDWTQIGPIDLPPSGFSSEVHVRGEPVTRSVNISLDGYVPPAQGFYMAQREFKCNPLQRLLPLTVKSPVTEYRLDSAD